MSDQRVSATGFSRPATDQAGHCSLAGELPGDTLQMMRAAVLRRPGEIVLEERPVPVPADDEVLIRVASVGVCGSDVHYFRAGRVGEFVVGQPLVLGHEAAGTIVAAGRDVPGDRIGQRVAIEPQRPCRVCAQCTAGRYNLCPDMTFYATPPVDGAFCEYVTIQAPFAHPVPDRVSDDAAALLEPLSVGIWASRKAGIGPGDRVLISGAGPIGLVTAQAARAFGAAEVIVSEPDLARRASAGRLGATAVLDPADGLPAALDADAFIECSGAPGAAAAGIAAVRPAGTVVLVGMGVDEVALPLPLIQQRELTLTGTFRYAGTWPAAIHLAATGQADLDGLVSARYGLDEVTRALSAGSAPGFLKAMVTP
jgi:L-iditol 2-dehydrogenase